MDKDNPRRIGKYIVLTTKGRNIPARRAGQQEIYYWDPRDVNPRGD